MSISMRYLCLLFCLSVVVACVHPQRATSLSPVQDLSGVEAPPDLIRLSFQSAIIPPTARGGQPWDEDGSPPDPFVRVYRAFIQRDLQDKVVFIGAGKLGRMFLESFFDISRHDGDR